MTPFENKMVYITKYALTRGIIEAIASQSKHNPCCIDLRCVMEPRHRDFIDYSYTDPRHWYLTIEEARAKAEEMRQKKIDSLEKKLTKLISMEF